MICKNGKMLTKWRSFGRSQAIFLLVFGILILLQSGCRDLSKVEADVLLADTIDECGAICATFVEREEKFTELALLLMEKHGFQVVLHSENISMMDFGEASIRSPEPLTTENCTFYGAFDLSFLESISVYQQGKGYVSNISYHENDDVAGVVFHVDTTRYDAYICYSQSGAVLTDIFNASHEKRLVEWLTDNWYIEYYLLELI